MDSSGGVYNRPACLMFIHIESILLVMEPMPGSTDGHTNKLLTICVQDSYNIDVFMYSKIHMLLARNFCPMTTIHSLPNFVQIFGKGIFFLYYISMCVTYFHSFWIINSLNIFSTENMND